MIEDKKIVFISILLTALFLGIGIYIYEKKQNIDIEPLEEAKIEELSLNTIYYYGDGCPACAQLDEFIQEKGIQEKVKYIKKEIFDNEENQNELLAVSKYCGIENPSVPFLFDEKKCFSGVKDVLDRLESKIPKSK